MKKVKQLSPGRILEIILTDTTCGLTCWYAREDVCRCSCGGRNHGVMLDPDNPVPERVCKIQGHRYRLESFGPYQEMMKLARRINGSYGWQSIRDSITYADGTPFHYPWYEGEKGSPAVVKAVSEKQLTTWPEFEAIRKQAKKEPGQLHRPHLFWVNVDPPKVNYCKGQCAHCDIHRMEGWV